MVTDFTVVKCATFVKDFGEPCCGVLFSVPRWERMPFWHLRHNFGCCLPGLQVRKLSSSESVTLPGVS